MSFCFYLQEKRKQLNLTQAQLAEKLQVFSSELNAVDAVTISRWERKKTTPSTYKQGLIIHFMGDNLIQQNAVFEINHVPTTIFDINNGLENRYTVGSPYADSPYIDPTAEIQLHKAKEDDIPEAFLEDISSFDNRLYHNVFSVDISTIYQRAQTQACIDFYAYSIKQQLQGHVIFMFFPDSLLDDFRHRPKSDISLEHLLDPRETSSIAYIGSMYSGTKSIGKHMYASLLYYLEVYPKVRYFILEIHNQPMLQFCQSLGFEIMFHGQQSDQGAIKIDCIHYRSVRTCISVEKFLSHPHIIELIRLKLHHFALLQTFTVNT
ncbi:MAG: helix-turn-helix transcriptional regulator [Pseudomonadales bacterium]|nr:helix-turn-helix transcriptional regulator [Pseudomonadales bacterium]